MLTFIPHYRTAWNDYFTVSNPNLLSSRKFTSRQTPSYTSLYILNCLFISITATDHGGALSCTSVTYLLVESTSFFTCKTSAQYGGAIYFSNSGGQCVLYEVCSYECYSTYTSTSYGLFARIVVKNGISSKNYVNYSSIIRCLYHTSNSHGSLYLNRGKFLCPSVNFSMNKCNYGSAFYYELFSDPNSVTCSFSYSTFADNIANQAICLYFWSSGANSEFKYCNIIRNTQNYLNDYGTFSSNGNVVIEDSCILENNANTMFNQRSSYTFTISNCTIDSTTNNGYLTIRNTVTKSFIFALNHMSTQNCHSGYDAIGYITLITLHQNPTKTQICLCTHGNSYYQMQIQYLASLMSVILFTFIHLDTSTYPLY
jgi:hypothetical protein